MTTTRTETETREIPFETRRVRDPELPRGSKRIDQPGVPGEERLRFQVTLRNGQPTGRRLIDTTVTRQPEDRVVAFGSRRDDHECRRPLPFCLPLGRSGDCPPRTPVTAQQMPVTAADVSLSDEQMPAPSSPVSFSDQLQIPSQQRPGSLQQQVPAHPRHLPVPSRQVRSYSLKAGGEATADLRGAPESDEPPGTDALLDGLEPLDC